MSYFRVFITFNSFCNVWNESLAMLQALDTALRSDNLQYHAPVRTGANKFRIIDLRLGLWKWLMAVVSATPPRWPMCMNVYRGREFCINMRLIQLRNGAAAVNYRLLRKLCDAGINFLAVELEKIRRRCDSAWFRERGNS